MAKELIGNINIATFERILAPAYRARIPVLAIGHKGIGKSEVVKKFCLENGLRYVDIRLAYMEAQDMVGFPFRDTATGRMVFAPPDWLPMEGDGILFLDEINRARIDVLQAVFQLVRDREIGGIRIEGKPYRLPGGWSIVAAMNPDTDSEQYYVSPIDESLYDRFLKAGLEFDMHSFKNYALSSELFSETVKSFIADQDLHMAKDPLEVYVDATPRTFEMFSRIYMHFDESERDLAGPVGEGLIGPANTEKFVTYLDSMYREVDELMEEIFQGRWQGGISGGKIMEYRDSRHDIIMAIRDRFIIRYGAGGEGYHRLKSSGELENFIRYLFSLYDEQIIAYLIALKESMKGEYLPGILGVIKSDPALGRHYALLVENNPDERVGVTI